MSRVATGAAKSIRGVGPVYPRACRPIHSTWPTGRRQSWHWGLAACGWCPVQLSAAMVRGAAEAASGRSARGESGVAAEQVCRAWWAEIHLAVVCCGADDRTTGPRPGPNPLCASTDAATTSSRMTRARQWGLKLLLCCGCVLDGEGSFDPGPSPATQPPQRPPFDPAASRPPCRTLLHSLALPAFRCFHSTRSRRTTSE